MPEEGSAMWALAGLSESLPAGAYRLDAVPEGGDPSRLTLGWALGTYAFDLYRKDEKKKDSARLVWPEGADRGLVERLAGAICLARDLINTPASDLGPAELAEAAERVAAAGGAQCRVIVGVELRYVTHASLHSDGLAGDAAAQQN